jgi:hypothetical protein
MAGAQTSPPTGMGATSPLGTILSEPSSNSNTSGIPLGATELSTPGISPLQMPCPMTTSNSAFDGGGSTATSACGSAATSGTSMASGTASGLAPTMGSTSGSGIPMGATDLGTPGESQNIAIPNVPVTPCTMTNSATPLTPTTSGMASASGC